MDEFLSSVSSMDSVFLPPSSPTKKGANSVFLPPSSPTKSGAKSHPLQPTPLVAYSDSDTSQNEEDDWSDEKISKTFTHNSSISSSIGK